MQTKKTLDEVKKHCVAYGYTTKARTQICAFLVGAGLKGTQESLRFKIGDRNFEEFVNWYNSTEEELVLERGRFVLIDNGVEKYPALILEAFDDACTTVSDTGLFCVTNDMIVGYADVEDMARLLESFIEFNLCWDNRKQQLLPYWHVTEENEDIC